VHLADAGFGQVEGDADLAHGHLLVVVKDEDELLGAVELADEPLLEVAAGRVVTGVGDVGSAWRSCSRRGWPEPSRAHSRERETWRTCLAPGLKRRNSSGRVSCGRQLRPRRLRASSWVSWRQAFSSWAARLWTRRGPVLGPESSNMAQRMWFPAKVVNLVFCWG